MNAFKEAIYITIMVTILALMALAVISLEKAVDRMVKIEESINSPRIARTSVMHGFYQDQRDPKKSGLRMIRVWKDGTLVVMPLMPPQVPEKKNAPSK